MTERSRAARGCDGFRVADDVKQVVPGRRPALRTVQRKGANPSFPAVAGFDATLAVFFQTLPAHSDEEITLGCEICQRLFYTHKTPLPWHSAFDVFTKVLTYFKERQKDSAIMRL